MGKMNKTKNKMLNILKIMIIIFLISVLTVGIVEAGGRHSPPAITSYSPGSLTINDTAPASENFSITVNQTVTVRWYLDGVLNKTSNYVKFSNDIINTSAIGTHNVTAIASNSYGSASKTWTWNVENPELQIIFYEPAESIVYDTEPANRRFGITVNQDANVSFSWNDSDFPFVLEYPYIPWPAGEEFFLNDTGQMAGTFIITFNATNANGFVSRQWTWYVSPQ